MSRSLVFTGLTLDDLDEIFDFIAADNPRRARTYIEEIRQACRGRCQVGGGGDAESLRVIRSSRSGCDADHLAPSAKGGVSCGTVLIGGQAMAAELEMVVDTGVGGEEALGMAG